MERPSLSYITAIVSRLDRLAEAKATPIGADAPLVLGDVAYRVTYDPQADALILVTEAEWRRRIETARAALKRRVAETARPCRPDEDWNA